MAEGVLPNDRTALALLFDPGVAGSLVSTLGVLVEASYSVREQLSADTWQLVGDIEEELGRFRRRPPTQFVGAQPSLLRLQRSLLALSGVSAENMERDPAWLFLDGGRRLERAQGLVRLLRSVLVDRRSGVVEDLLVESLLSTSESLIIFRRRAGSTLHVSGAIDLLVYDVANPRSVLFQLDRLVDHLAGLPKQSSAQRLGNEERLALEATTLLRLTDADRLAVVDPATGAGRELDSVFATVDGLLDDLLDSLRDTYFAHERLSVLAGGRPEDPGAGHEIPDRAPHRVPLQRAGDPVPQRGPPAPPRHRPPDLPDHELVVDPTPTGWGERADFYGNPVASFVVDGPFDDDDGHRHQHGRGDRRGPAAGGRAGVERGARPAHPRPQARHARRPRVLLRVTPGVDGHAWCASTPWRRSASGAPWSTPSPTSPSGSTATSSTTPGSPP